MIGLDMAGRSFNPESSIALGIEFHNDEMLKRLNSKTPLFTLELLILLGSERLPEGNYFEGTTLTGCEGKTIFELSQPELEKITLWAAGFTRNFAYTAAEMTRVSPNYSAESLKEEIESLVGSFSDKDANIGIRILPLENGETGITSKPFAWVLPGDDNYLIQEGDLLYLATIKRDPDTGERIKYLLKPGDHITTFPSPPAVEREMIFENIDKFGRVGAKKEDSIIEKQEDVVEKERTIKLGGGFSCELGGYDPSTEIFTLTFNFITNDGNTRGIGQNDGDLPKVKVNLDVVLESGKFVLISEKNREKSKDARERLKDAVESKNIMRVMNHVAEDILLKESRALANLFITSLRTYPKLRFHSIQGLFAVEEGDKIDKKRDKEDLGSSWFIFDTGGAEEIKFWDPDYIDEANVRNPGPLLKALYEKKGAPLRELELSEQLLLYQLLLNENFRKFFGPNASATLIEIESWLEDNYFRFKKRVSPVEPNVSPYGLSKEETSEVVGIARKETNAIIQSLVGKRYGSYSAESLFGKLMWEVIGRSEFRKVKTMEEVPGYKNVYEYKHGKNIAIILDQGDFQIGFLVKNGEIFNLEEVLNDKKQNSRVGSWLNVESKMDRLELVKEIAVESFGLEFKIPKMARRRDTGSD